MRWLDGITDWMDTNLNKLWERVKDRKAWYTAVHRVAKNKTWLSDWTMTEQCTSGNVNALFFQLVCLTVPSLSDCSLLLIELLWAQIWEGWGVEGVWGTGETHTKQGWPCFNSFDITIHCTKTSFTWLREIGWCWYYQNLHGARP